ncbi:MAG: ion transporter [Bacteroidia bacterium]|nr:ion transporter [Bacteroidia bacterium]
MKKALQRLFTEDRIVAFVIMLNAIVLFILSYEQYIHNRLLSTLDAIFLFYFLMEAIIKIRLMGWRKYISSGWNKFDFAIVILSLPSVILLFMENMPDFAVIFVFRIVRVLRFFKFIKFIPNIDELVAGIRRALKASVFVLLAFFVYCFIVSLISCRLFQHISPEMFGDPIRSLYNVFKVFTIEGWFEVPEAIIAQAEMNEVNSFFTIGYFILIVISGGIFGLSIVNAIFVEEMVRDNNDDLIVKIEAMDEKMNHIMKMLANQNGQASNGQTEHEERPLDSEQELS